MKKFSTKTSFNVIQNIGIFAASLLITVVSVYIYSPVTESDAAEITVSGNEGYDSISLSTDDTVNIDIIPTAEQEIYSSINTLTISNTCSHGATVSITTGSVTNKLVRVGSDAFTKEINPTTGSALVNDSWGYSIDSGTTYHAVPSNTGTPVQVYNSSQAAYNDLVHIKYGVKTDYNLPSGKYVNDVVYTVAVKPACLEYGVNWNLNNGTAASGKTYPTTLHYGDKINLAELAPTRENYIFTGWSNGSTTFDGSETNANINPYNASNLTMTAQWEQAVFDFDYTGNDQPWNIPRSGYYKIEAWGASGGNANNGEDGNYRGGYGGYSVGLSNLSQNNTLHVYVGGGGNIINGFDNVQTVGNGYNGGGNVSRQQYVCYVSGSGGGGATHVATASGELRYITDPSAVLIVAGGGGGATVTFGNVNNVDACHNHSGIGGDGGGESGDTGEASQVHSSGNALGGTQLAAGTNSYAMNDHIQTAASFGLGCAAVADSSSIGGNLHISGGGGWYGGSCGRHGGGGGGSGYIGNSNLVSSSSVTKHMTCHSCTVSNTPESKTESNNDVSADAESDHSKIGNGHVRITWIGTSI